MKQLIWYIVVNLKFWFKQIIQEFVALSYGCKNRKEFFQMMLDSQIHVYDKNMVDITKSYGKIRSGKK